MTTIDGRLITTIVTTDCWKPTHTKRHIHFNLHYHQNTIIGVLRGMKVEHINTRDYSTIPEEAHHLAGVL